MPRLLELLGLDEETLRWEDLAACKNMYTELFYSEYERDVQMAKAVDAVCESCPVRQQCLKAGRTGNNEGVWGGYFLVNGKIDKQRNKHKTKEQMEWADDNS